MVFATAMIAAEGLDRRLVGMFISTRIMLAGMSARLKSGTWS
jgi:hypothetical protein